jgi:FKBP-type peptidyl-prolyl cis-trans isomerase (trigger factor)
MTKRTVEMLLRSKLEASSKTRVAASRVALPNLECPDIDDIEVELDVPEAPSKDDIDEAILHWAKSLSDVRTRAAGEQLSDTDELVVDLVGYAGGHVVPMSAKRAVSLEGEAETLLPGLRRAALKHKVGDSFVVGIRFPLDHPFAPVAGASITYAVDILAALERRPLDMDEAELFRRAHLQSEEELVAAFGRVLDAERWVDFLSAVRQRAVDEAIRRTPRFEVPKAAIDEEILARWTAEEGMMLRARSIPNDEINRTMAYALADSSLRAEAEESIKAFCVLGAIAQKHEAELDKKVIGERIRQLSAVVRRSNGETPFRFDDDKESLRFAELMVYEMALALLMSRVMVALRSGGECRKLPFSQLSDEVAARTLTLPNLRKEEHCGS